MTTNVNTVHEDIGGWDLMKNLWHSFKDESTKNLNSQDSTLGKIGVIFKSLACLPAMSLLAGAICVTTVFECINPLNTDDRPVPPPRPTIERIPSPKHSPSSNRLTMPSIQEMLQNKSQ